MRARQIIGLCLGVITVPVLVAGLLDPLEGGLALLVGGFLLLVTFVVSRVAVPRLAWMGWASAVGLAVVTLVAVAQYYPLREYPWWIWALAISYELAAAVAAAGGVVYAVRLVRRVRSERTGQSPNSRTRMRSSAANSS